jgi:hypothetical protein
MGKQSIIPAVQRFLHRVNFLVRKNSGGKIFGGEIFHNQAGTLEILFFLTSSDNIYWIFKVYNLYLRSFMATQPIIRRPIFNFDPKVVRGMLKSLINNFLHPYKITLQVHTGLAVICAAA